MHLWYGLYDLKTNKTKQNCQVPTIAWNSNERPLKSNNKNYKVTLYLMIVRFSFTMKLTYNFLFPNNRMVIPTYNICTTAENNIIINNTENVLGLEIQYICKWLYRVMCSVCKIITMSLLIFKSLFMISDKINLYQFTKYFQFCLCCQMHRSCRLYGSISVVVDNLWYFDYEY